MKNEEKKDADQTTQTNAAKVGNKVGENKKFPGYPHYPPSEDIYNREKEVDLNPEDLSEKKGVDNNPGMWNEKTFPEDMTGEDLDVPGSKADEKKGNPGSADEENNYYSLGGDNHNDLEEDQG